MTRFKVLTALVVISLFWSGGCAMTGGLLQTVAPTLRFIGFNSVSIQPEGVQFEVKLGIKNNMPISLPLNRIEYQFDLNQKRLVTGTFNQFAALQGFSEQEVTFPFQLAWKDLVAQATSGSTSGQVYKVGFNGSLFVSESMALPAIPFSIEKTLPVPKLPKVGFVGTEGSPLGERFALNFKIKNENSFPIWMEGADTSLQLNQKNYELVQSGSAPRFEPGETQTLSLAMTNTLGKGIDMLANALLSGKMDFKASGKVRFGTPYGTLVLPVNTMGRTQ